MSDDKTRLLSEENDTISEHGESYNCSISAQIKKVKSCFEQCKKEYVPTTQNTNAVQTKPLSYVQQMSRQFDALAASQHSPDSSSYTKKCNWWLKNLAENENYITSSGIGNQTHINADSDNSNIHVEDQGDSNTEYYEEDKSEDAFEPEEDYNGHELNEIVETSLPLDSRYTISSNQIPHIIQELLENEQHYINTLTKGITCYQNIFDELDLPNPLRGQKYNIFGNIERIREFHQNRFRPSLKECDENVEKLGDIFTKFIEENYFYIYVQYTMNKHKSNKICELHRDYFKGYQDKVKDKLGINSVLVQPIQRLPKYQLLISQLIKELQKNMECDGALSQMASCCKAEKRIQRLLDTANESMSISDIVDCNVINILEQGKFYKMSEFDINDSKKKYRGKAFLFDKCVIYTETINKHTLQFRGYIPHNTSDHIYEEGTNKFNLLFLEKGNQDIKFVSDCNTTNLWVNLLTEIRELRKSMDIAKRNMELKRHSSLSNSRRSIDSDKFSVIFRKHSICSANTSSSGSSAWTSGTSASSDSDIDYTSTTNRARWYGKIRDIERCTARLINSEKHYAQLLKEYFKIYLSHYAQNSLKTYLESLNNIIRVHKNYCYPNLINCELNVTFICHVLKETFNHDFIKTYRKYSASAPLAQQIIIEKNPEQTSNIQFLVNLPISHLNAYYVWLECLIADLTKNEADFTGVSDLLKDAMVVETELYKFRENVYENYRLNTFKDSIHFSCGLIIFSELVSINNTNHRLFVLKKGLVCVKVRDSSKTKAEKYIELLFMIPLNDVGSLTSSTYPTRIKIFAFATSNISYKIYFRTSNKRSAFMEKFELCQRAS